MRLHQRKSLSENGRQVPSHTPSRAASRWSSWWEHMAYFLVMVLCRMFTLFVLLPLVVLSFQIAALKCLEKRKQCWICNFSGWFFLFFFCIMFLHQWKKNTKNKINQWGNLILWLASMLQPWKNLQDKDLPWIKANHNYSHSFMNKNYNFQTYNSYE